MLFDSAVLTLQVHSVSAVAGKTWTGFTVMWAFFIGTGGMDWITMHWRVLSTLRHEMRRSGSIHDHIWLNHDRFYIYLYKPNILAALIEYVGIFCKTNIYIYISIYRLKKTKTKTNNDTKLLSDRHPQKPFLRLGWPGLLWSNKQRSELLS